MPEDGERGGLTALIARKMIEPEFTDLLKRAPDGSIPVVPALRSDRIADALAEVEASGGVANLVVPVSNALMIVSLSRVPGDCDHGSHGPAVLSADETVGVLLARLIEDGGMEKGCTYRFATHTREHLLRRHTSETTSAELLIAAAA